MTLTIANAPPSLSGVLGVASTLPGESPDQYQMSLDTLLIELGATTVLQVYLAEKIHECLWWIRRYEAQKRATIIAGMALIADGGFNHKVTEKQEHVRNSLFVDTIDKKTAQALSQERHTLESLQQEAMGKKQSELLQLDQQVALQMKILTGMQRSYEVASNRKLHRERLQLQNGLLRCDLLGIEVAEPESNA